MTKSGGMKVRRIINGVTYIIIATIIFIIKEFLLHIGFKSIFIIDSLIFVSGFLMTDGIILLFGEDD